MIFFAFASVEVTKFQLRSAWHFSELLWHFLNSRGLSFRKSCCFQFLDEPEKKKILAKFFANEAERLTVQCTSALIALGCIKEQLWKLDPGKTLLTASERKNSFTSIFSLNRNLFLAQILHLSARLLFPCSERFLSFQLWKNLWSVECFLSAHFMRSLLRLHNFKLLLFH